MRSLSAVAILALLTISTTVQRAASYPGPGSLDFPAQRSKAALASAGGCTNAPLGGNCPENAPCCSGAGYCGSDPSFCAESCQSSGSFAPDSCWPLPMAVNLEDNFKDKSRMVAINNYNGFPNTADWVIDRSPGTQPHAVITDDDKLVLKLNRLEKHPETGGGIGGTIHSTRWMKYGTIEARFKTAANVPGPVSSFILISPVSGDEIDFEVVGKDSTDMQTNFYYKVQPGRPVNYAHGKHINVGIDTSADYHTYKLEWTETEMKWYFDGELKRTTTVSDAKGEYPDTPMRVAFGLWDGGYGNEGTAEWAGKDTSYGPDEKREYQMLVDWVKITPQFPDNSTEPWPGAKYQKQMENGKNGGSGKNGGVSDDDPTAGKDGASGGGHRNGDNGSETNKNSALGRSLSAAQMGGSLILVALAAMAPTVFV